MSKVSLEKPVPEFELPATSGRTLKLSALKGKNIVLYFYPKDATSGCTLEAVAFNQSLSKLKRLNTVVLGVSRDDLKSHEKFRRKYALKFDLLSDENEAVCKLFDVMKMKNMYGRKYRGIERSTFLIDATGVLRMEWRKVAVKGHVDDVLKAIKALN
jgi:thioredoxin-dependent peroxiredoxin